MSFENRHLYGVAADVLSLSRIVGAPLVASWLRTTPPEQRTRKHGLIVGALGATDKLDGLLGRKAGDRPWSKWLDRWADKIYATLVEKALSDNGEISPLHWQLKVLRDGVVEVARLRAQQHGAVTSSPRLNQWKTTVELGLIAAASSPLARRRGVLEGLAVVATGLSVITGVNSIRNLSINSRESL